MPQKYTTFVAEDCQPRLTETMFTSTNRSRREDVRQDRKCGNQNKIPTVFFNCINLLSPKIIVKWTWDSAPFSPDCRQKSKFMRALWARLCSLATHVKWQIYGVGKTRKQIPFARLACKLSVKAKISKYLISCEHKVLKSADPQTEQSCPLFWWVQSWMLQIVGCVLRQQTGYQWIWRQWSSQESNNDVSSWPFTTYTQAPASKRQDLSGLMKRIIEPSLVLFSSAQFDWEISYQESEMGDVRVLVVFSLNGLDANKLLRCCWMCPISQKSTRNCPLEIHTASSCRQTIRHTDEIFTRP